VAAYERLREAPDGGSAVRWGRALLLERGMAAWREALYTCDDRASPGRDRQPEGLGHASSVAETTLSPKVYDDAVDVFCEMVLSCCRS
jgi:hypothetical protein